VLAPGNAYEIISPGRQTVQKMNQFILEMTSYQNFGTVTNPATVTMSIGLLSDAQGAKVFAAYRDSQRAKARVL